MPAKNTVAAKHCRPGTRLAIETLESRNLLAAGPVCSLAWFLASAHGQQNSPPAIVSPPSDDEQADVVQLDLAALDGSQPPEVSPLVSPGGNVVTTLEDTAYTFTTSDFGFATAAGESADGQPLDAG